MKLLMEHGCVGVAEVGEEGSAGGLGEEGGYFFIMELLGHNLHEVRRSSRWPLSSMKVDADLRLWKSWAHCISRANNRLHCPFTQQFEVAVHTMT